MSGSHLGRKYVDNGSDCHVACLKGLLDTITPRTSECRYLHKWHWVDNDILLQQSSQRPTSHYQAAFTSFCASAQQCAWCQTQVHASPYALNDRKQLRQSLQALRLLWWFCLSELQCPAAWAAMSLSTVVISILVLICDLLLSPFKLKSMCCFVPASCSQLTASVSISIMEMPQQGAPVSRAHCNF